MMVMADNKYDEIYDIRLASVSDIPMIMEFVNRYWKKGHVIGVNRELFEYEYVHGDEVDFILAIKKEKATLEAIFGFIRCTRKRSGDIWGSMWMVNENGSNMSLLGIELSKRVYGLTGCSAYIGNGANPKTTVPIRKVYFRDKVARMKQFYWLNSNIGDYKIASINEPWIPEKDEDAPVFHLKKFNTFTELNNEFDIDVVDGIPHKDTWYINHRYFQHPVYSYDIYGIDDGKKTRAIFMAREIAVNGSRVLRIVDYMGSHGMISGIYDALKSLVREHGYEYVDFFEYGIPDEYIKKAGFRNREDFDNIIPNYFEPFVQENIDIWVHYKKDGTTFFKGDGDQDRPNVIPL